MAVSLIRFSGLVEQREFIKSSGNRTRCGVCGNNDTLVPFYNENVKITNNYCLT